MVDSLSRDHELLRLLEKAVEELKGLLQPEEEREAAEHKRLSNGCRDSAGLHTTLFQVLKTFGELQCKRVCELREILCSTANTLTEQRMCLNLAHTLPDAEPPTTADVDASYGSHFFQDHMTDVILHVLEDVHAIINQFSVMSRRLDAGIAFLSEVSEETDDPTTSGPLKTAKNMKTESSSTTKPLEQFHEEHSLANIQSIRLTDDPTDPVKGCTVVKDDRNRRDEISHTRTESADENIVESLNVNDEVDEEKEGEEREKSKGEEGEKLKQTLVTVGLADRGGSSKSPKLCYMMASADVVSVMSCEVVDGLSSLMVSGSEELLSAVLRIQTYSHVKCPFPLTVAVPFQANYRGNYREIIVKVVDPGQRVSYVTPLSTEGFFEGQRGSFAVVRVYTLGVFAVLSRLRTESFTVSKAGLSLKLSVDSRICLDYLPGSFITPVVAQVMVQPVDAFILSSLKSKNDSYREALTSTPLLYLSHPSSLKLRRPLTISLPCPPICDKRKAAEDADRPALASNAFSPKLMRVDGASVKTHKCCKEQLALLGWMENHWKVLDKVSVKNLQNSLVCFELTESYERLIVLRLQSSVKSSCLALLVEELEEAVKSFSVTVVLHHKHLDPRSVVVETLSSRDASWAMCELQDQGYCGPPESSSELSMREGEQLLVRLSGNITCAESISKEQTDSLIITFHNQRRNRLYLTLKEVDTFGNHSSLHYKGVASFFKVSKDHLVWSDDRAYVKDCLLEEPVCRLPITLPKGARTVFQPVRIKLMQPSQTEPLSDELLSWLCEELTEDDAALLVLSLRLRRSSVQIARLRAPHSLSQQAFHILTAWRRGLPSSSLKCPILAHCLTRAGRPDLANQLLLKGAANHQVEEKHEDQTSRRNL
ncbi:death domain-containing protein 1 isoform X1 [Danio rerio]|uniref:Death domain-containing protein 1 isoform X1 n=1 Tax=Danio rerio TaxID=7955 RepID=A0AB32TZJ8_DANRE